MFLMFSSVSGSSQSTGQHYHCSARITWPAPWTWSWDQRSNSGLCWLRSWETAQCVCTVPIVMEPSHMVLAGTAPAQATITITTTTIVRRPLSAKQYRWRRRQSPSTLHVYREFKVFGNWYTQTPCISGNIITVKCLNYTLYISHIYNTVSAGIAAARFTKTQNLVH